MSETTVRHVTAFEGGRKIASGEFEQVAALVRSRVDRDHGSAALIFDDETGHTIEIDHRGRPGYSDSYFVSPASEQTEQLAGPGRPKLGVIAREVTLLPRHWEWLGRQRGGASAAIRRLVEEARRVSSVDEQRRISQEAAYRFLTVIAGDAPGYEEALRALFASDADKFEDATSQWSKDIKDYAWRLASDAFAARE